MPSPWFASFIKIIQQLILPEGHNVTHAGQDTHILRALLGSRGGCVLILLYGPPYRRFGWLAGTIECEQNVMGKVTAW